MRTLRLYGLLLGTAVRSQAQYRANLLILVLGGIAYQGAGFVFIWVILSRFGAIGGWTLEEVAFLYAIRLTAHGVFVIFFNQLLQVDQIVREGEYDRYLVRPLNPLLQLLTRRMQLTSVGDLVGGLVLLAVTSGLVEVSWSPVSVVYLVLAILGGGLIEASVQLACAALSFRLLSTLGLRVVGDDLFNLFGGYPLKIFPSVARFALTFLVPLAFVAYVPASVLLGSQRELAIPAVVAYAAPLLGLLVMTAAYRLWRYQSRFYTSSGH